MADKEHPDIVAAIALAQTYVKVNDNINDTQLLELFRYVIDLEETEYKDIPIMLNAIDQLNQRLKLYD